MDSEQWRRIEKIYHSVLARPVARRAAVLDESCQGDPNLRQEVESLLNAREEAGGFLSPEELHDHLADIASEPAPAVVGLTLSHYEVLAKIGAGAMGVVYRARDNRLDRDVALKILPAQFTHDAGRVALFRREAKAASALNHLNIVTIYDIGEAGGAWFIAAEFIPGITLRERLAAGKLRLIEALDVATQCAAALNAAHAAGIVHRDIKPENILIRPDGVIKVVDFGLATISETRIREAGQEPVAQASEGGGIMGTPRYMSPEQARGEKLDPRTDIFSLGAVLYEMVTGRPAFPGKNAAEVFAALLGGSDPLSNDGAPGGPLGCIIRKALEKDREMRYQTVEELATDLRTVDRGRSVGPIQGARLNKRYVVLALVLLLAAAIGLFFYFRHGPLLTDQDTVLLVDFTNLTGDPVFDPTLKQGLAVQLEQSPRLTIFPDDRVRETLRLMGRQPDERITADVAREICQRLGLKAMITGSIAPLGSHYAITLEAADSHSGETLARAQVEAGQKEEVLQALSLGAARLREKMGESLKSIRRYDALLERTTSSLDALRAYSLSYQERRRGKPRAAIPFLRKAVELDPEFAFAYSDLATMYHNTGRPGLAAEYASKAYALRDRVSERERLRITSLYYEDGTGEIDKNIETLKLYQQIYPRDPVPHNNLGVNYSSIGQYELALEESRVAMRLDPDSAARFSTLATDLIHLNRFGEAKEVCERALRQKLDNPNVHHALYRIAFATGDRAAMEQYRNWFAGKPNEYTVFERQAASAAYRGQWHLSSEHARRAILAATKNDAQESGALYTARAALHGAIFGRCLEARSAAAQSLSMEHAPASLPPAILALELCGETTSVQMGELIRLYPKNTVLKSIWLPVLRAAVEMNRGNDTSAIELLRPVVNYEAAAEFWPQYLRGQAYLRLRKGSDSAAEFRKILEHRGQAVDSVLYPLAYLGVARAAVLLGDRAQARQSYQAFLMEWKDSDTDLPSRLSAQKELEKLK